MTGSALLSCEALRNRLAAEDQVILDATFFLPRQQRNARAEYRRSHLPGASFFDIDVIADPNNPLPHSLPSAEQFAQAAGKLGIGDRTLIVVYDNNHFFAAARAWWMFRVFGHDRVKVLDGGLVRWRKLGYPEETVTPPPQMRTFTPRYRPELFCSLSEMRQIALSGNRQILDARSPDSFQGLRPVTDFSPSPGHIPGSLNIPYAGLTDHEQRLLSVSELRALFASAGADLNRSIVTSCGSGVSAAVIALALYQLGIDRVPLYDGSWAEWGRQSDTPKQACR